MECCSRCRFFAISLSRFLSTGLTEKEYLDYLRRTERRKYSASKMVRIYKERPRKFSSSIMTYRTVSFVFLAIHLILTAAIIICTFLPIHFGARQAFGLMAANLIIGGGT